MKTLKRIRVRPIPIRRDHITFARAAATGFDELILASTVRTRKVFVLTNSTLSRASIVQFFFFFFCPAAASASSSSFLKALMSVL